jgi:hypothetical protein
MVKAKGKKQKAKNSVTLFLYSEYFDCRSLLSITCNWRSLVILPTGAGKGK